MKKILALLIITAIAIGGYFYMQNQQQSDEMPEFSKIYNSQADAESDLNFAIAIAKEQNKHILLEVGGDWCPWCRAFDKFVKDNSQVNEYLNDNYVLVKVYYGKGNYNGKFLAGFPRLIATPHFYTLDSEGSVLKSQGSEVLEKGRSYDVLKVMAFLQKYSKK